MGPSCTKKGQHGPHSKWKRNLFSRNSKSRTSASKNFLFYQNVKCLADLGILFYFVWYLLAKKVSFLAKATMERAKTHKNEKMQKSYNTLVTTYFSSMAVKSPKCLNVFLNAKVFWNIFCRAPKSTYFFPHRSLSSTKSTFSIFFI